ncbi:TA system VapC family ribonuclease toxin [Terracidiphilus sp.]|uniref:TA system VapC family ribonuclease toxin n=1 Tax=Terracidiphilus sp. TaxID=1964191 RepID=UPI003C1DB89D
MSTDQRHLLDVNVLIAILDEQHSHHEAVRRWFDQAGIEWALSPFTEAGFLRIVTHPRVGMSIEKAEALLEILTKGPGYHYLPITTNWRTLTRPFRRQIHGHNQVTDAWLLGMALEAGMALVTFDRAMLHLAGEHRGSVVLLEG